MVWLSTPDDDDEGSSPGPRNRACVCGSVCVLSAKLCYAGNVCVRQLQGRQWVEGEEFYEAPNEGNGWQSVISYDEDV